MALNLVLTQTVADALTVLNYTFNKKDTTDVVLLATSPSTNKDFRIAYLNMQVQDPNGALIINRDSWSLPWGEYYHPGLPDSTVSFKLLVTPVPWATPVSVEVYLSSVSY